LINASICAASYDRENVLEQSRSGAADEALQVFEVRLAGAVGDEHLLDRAADIGRGIEQSAVDIEQVNREIAGSRRLRPLAFREAGKRRPPSGRITCWVWLRRPCRHRRIRGGSVSPLMSGAPRRHPGSRVRAAFRRSFTSASECFSMMAAAVS
jgi:hypothetical protein